MATVDNSHLRKLGSQFGEYVSKQKGNIPSPAALQGVIADLAAGESELIAPLRDLVSKQSFAALLPYARSNGGRIQRDALIQEISRVYHPDVLVRVEEVLNGFLDASGGIATSLMQDQSSVQPEKAVITNEVSPLDRMISEKAKHVTSGQQTHPVVDKSRTASSSDRTHPIVAVAIFGATAIAAAGLYLSMNPGVSCSAIADKLEPLASDVPEFKKLVSENKETCSDDARFLVQQAYMLNSQNDHSQALQLINKSLKIQPDNAFAYKVRGQAYFGLKDYKNSLSAYSRSLELDPKDTWAAYGKGIALSWLGRRNEAITWYSEAINLDHKNYAAYRERGSEKGLRIEPPQYFAGLTDLDKAININSKDGYLYLIRSYIKTWVVDWKGACIDQKKARDLGEKKALMNSKEIDIDLSIKEICPAP